jgi:hypothetical protein
LGAIQNFYDRSSCEYEWQKCDNISTCPMFKSLRIFNTKFGAGDASDPQ